MGNEYIINGTEEVVDAFTANSGIVVPVGQTINNAGSYVGTPIVTSITAGSGISVTNPASPGAATVSATSYFASIGSASAVSTTSTTPVSTGLGILFTPTMSGNVLVMTTASISNSTSHIGTSAGIGWQAGTALVALGGAMVNNSAVVTNDNGFNIPATTIFNLSLTVGDEYAIQPIFYVAADTGAFTLANMIVLELP